MTVTASIDAEQHVVTLHFTGATSFEEWQATMDRLLADAAYRPGMCILSDHRDADDVPTAEHVRAVVEYLDRHADAFPGCGWAIIARDLADFGMNRMAEMLAERTHVSFRAFRQLDEARVWLADRDGPAELRSVSEPVVTPVVVASPRAPETP